MNILFLVTDDHRSDGAQALGSPDLFTPHLDRLIRRGTTLTDAFNLGSDEPSVDAASRAMLLTGKTYSNLPRSFYAPGEPGSDTAVETFPQFFRRQGYQTYAIGKWPNSRRSFQNAFAGGNQLLFGSTYEPGRTHLYAYDAAGRYPTPDRPAAHPNPNALFADAAVSFLHNRSDKKPFLLYVAFSQPPQPTAEWARRYDARRLRLPANFRPAPVVNTVSLNLRDEKRLPRPLQPDAIQAELARYYALISDVDSQIGRILKTLEETGQADRTLIVWTGSNGLTLGQHGLLSKQNLYDPSIRVPLVLTGPGIRRNYRSDALCYLHDVYPTLCELNGLPIPARLAGKSFAPVLTGQQKQHRDLLLFSFQPPMQQGVRTADGWKMIRYQVNNQTTLQLFHTRSDPHETQNLADERAYDVRKQEMLNLLNGGK